MKRHLWFFASIGISLFLLLMAFTFAPANSPLPFEESASSASQVPIIPRLDLTLANTTLPTINSSSKELKYQGNSLTVATDSTTFSFDDVEIKGRGNYTWEQDKKPYQIKLPHKTNLFNLGSSKKWILLADALDATHLRNDTAFYLANLLDQTYAVSGKHIELYVNGIYQGLYYLTPKIEIGPSRIALSDPYGILVEFDALHHNPDTATCYLTATSTCLVVKDLVNDTNESIAMTNFLTTYDQLEIAISNNDYQSVGDLIDLEDFAKYFLLAELTANPDAYTASLYFYQNGPDDQIHIGPSWDFDLAFRNPEWYWSDDARYYLPSTPTPQFLQAFNDSTYSSPDYSIFRIFGYLLGTPNFKSLLHDTYNQHLADHKDDLFDHIATQLSHIRPAIIADATHWSYDFDSAADLFLNWLSARYDYLNATYGTPA